MMTKKEARNILRAFDIKETVKSVVCIQSTERNGEYRHIYKINSHMHSWICRISNEENYPSQLVEKQSEFAMLLYQNGVITAKKRRSRGHYCLEYFWKDTRVRIILEEFLGEDFSNLTKNTFSDFGRILGQIHRISEESGMKIGTSYVSEALCHNKARFKSILGKAKPCFPDLEELKTLADIHDGLAENLGKDWNELPKGAVHGDLGLYNNFIDTKEGLGIIDFNLAGDEAYIGDVLSSFFASIHKYSWHEKLQYVDKEKAYMDFLASYCTQRVFKECEKKYFSKISALFDGIFFFKAIIEMWNGGEYEEALKSIPKAIEHFDPQRHSFPF